MRRIEYITFYDLKDNIVAQFDSVEDCAKYFNTTKGAIKDYLRRQHLHFPEIKKRDKETHSWGRLMTTYKITNKEKKSKQSKQF